ncbi:MAG: hypothetical protein Q9168_005104 [Polycauliona sp. 1 TL-2023]
MSFRLNFDLSFNFPPPPPRSQRPLLASNHSGNNASEETNKGLAGWLHTARLHPGYSLRLLYFLSAIAGIILANLVSINGWGSYQITDIHRSAVAFLVIGLLWQLVTLYDRRLFGGRQIPNWVLSIVETLGFLAFLALFIGNCIAVDNATYLALNEMLLVAYDSAVWVILCLLHGILAIKCYAQGWRNVRPKRNGCSECGHAHGKGKGRATDDEEALIGSENAEGEEDQAGPSEQVVSYRDEVEDIETSPIPDTPWDR